MDPDKKGLRIFSKKLGLDDMFIGLTVLLGIVVIINIVLTFGLNKDIRKNIETTQEKLKPAKIELTIVKDSKCSDCFDISAIASEIKNLNVDITKESTIEFDSKEGKEMISKYQIEKIPVIVIKGETEKISAQEFEKKGDALLFTLINPPYTEASTGQIKGRVALYYLKDSNCKDCNELAALISQIKAAGVKISEEKTIEASSEEGMKLREKYDIDFAPSVVLSKEAGVYGIIHEAWPEIGSQEKDGFYVLRLVSPPFINLTTGQVKGLVGIVYLTDKSCTECYDVNLHNQILTNPQSFAMKFLKEETYDISDAKGKELVDKYKITKVPTVILSDDIVVYPSIDVLKQFYSLENDAYVFRNAEIVGTYRDLEKNEVVEAQQQSQVQ